jgi:hypothetical protein
MLQLVLNAVQPIQTGEKEANEKTMSPLRATERETKRATGTSGGSYEPSMELLKGKNEAKPPSNHIQGIGESINSLGAARSSFR